MVDGGLDNVDWLDEAHWAIGVDVLDWWGRVDSHGAHIGLLLEDQLADPEQLVPVHVAVMVDIGLLENDHDLSAVVSAGVPDSGEEVIEEAVHLSGLHLAGSVLVIDSEQLVDVFQKFCVLHFP